MSDTVEMVDRYTTISSFCAYGVSSSFRATAIPSSAATCRTKSNSRGIERMSRKHKRSSSWRSTRAISPATRCAILHRDGFACVYCAKPLPVKGAQLDHLLPRKDGGKAIPTNLVTCCGPCNIDRARDRVNARKVLDAVSKACRPIDRIKGRELAREHYPPRMRTKAAPCATP